MDNQTKQSFYSQIRKDDLTVDEQKQLKERIRKMYLDSGEHNFIGEEAESFLETAAYYIEQEYLSVGQYKYKSLIAYSNDWKADAIVHAVAIKDYDWL